jgi:transposase
MVWGVISHKGVGPLVRIDSIEEGEATLNGERYLTILQRYLLRNYPTLKEQKLVFQQDNAPSHRYNRVASWIEEKEIEKLVWPPQSPDMSLIESVWNDMKFRLRGKVFTNKDQLWKALKREWRLISPSFIKDLYEGMPRRIGALLEAEGRHTKY